MHATASTGFSADPQNYHRARPKYAEVAVKKVYNLMANAAEKLGVTSLRVLEIGAGSGKFTHYLLNAPPTTRAWPGLSLTATEPLDSFRAELEKNIDQSRCAIKKAFAQNLPEDDNSMDVIICAQAFHWFATEETLKEFARVLVPGGLLVLVFNVRAEESSPFMQEFEEFLHSLYLGGEPRHESRDFLKMFPNRFFPALQHERFAEALTQSGPISLLDQRVASMSTVASLPTEQAEECIQRARAIAAKHHSNIDDPTFEIRIPYNEDVWWSERV